MGQWYRSQYASLLKEDKAAFGDLFGQLDGVRKPPRRPTLQHYYSTKWYSTRIKERFKERMEKMKRATFSGEDVHAVMIRNEVTQECWEDESEQFRMETERQRDKEHEIKLKAWRESGADCPSRTPEEYSTYVTRDEALTSSTELTC